MRRCRGRLAWAAIAVLVAGRGAAQEWIGETPEPAAPPAAAEPEEVRVLRAQFLSLIHI